MKSKAQYIIRFDDICPQMNWDVWDKVESILDKYNIKPILAVVPNNKDPLLNTSPANPNFWEKVRQWQKKGWSIGLHGYDHVYITQNSGLIGINNRSEFAGVPHSLQAEKLDKGISIFKSHNITIDCWVAPAHSFDKTTVSLLKERGISIISDGYFPSPLEYLDVLWIPQQIWRFRKFQSGIWTVCLHHNNWSKQKLSEFDKQSESFASQISSLKEITCCRSFKKAKIHHFLYSKLWLFAIKIKAIYKQSR